MSTTRLSSVLLVSLLWWTQGDAGTETYTYDALGRLSTVTSTDGTTTVTYTYDAAGNRSQVQVTDSSPPGAPGVPTYSNVTTTSMTVSWTAATDNIAVGSYEYQVNSGSWTNVGSALTANLTGLSSATQYAVAVRARDTDGNAGAASSSSRWTLPGAPGTPSFSSITSSSVTVSWTAPSGTVTSYAYSINGGSTWTNVGNVTSTAVTGLASATSYTVYVEALNAGGVSAASSASLTTLPGGVGTLSVSAVTASSATVSWGAASGAIIRYEYSLNGGSWTSVGSSISVGLTGLGVGSSNSVQVHAVDASGAGAASSASFYTLPGAPGTPTFSAITATTATMSWSAAAGTVTSYSYSLNNGSTWTSAGTALSVSLTGLSAGTAYTTLVRASNAGGTGPNSGPATLTTTPGAPGTPTFSSISTTTATMSWSAAAGTVTSYSYSLNNGSTWTSAGTALSVSLTGLSAGTVYTTLVRASNAGGTGPNSGSATLTTIPGAPGTPSVSSITATTATVNWTAAAGIVTSYAYTINGGSTWINVGANLYVNLASLSPKTAYTFQVHAINSSGAGSASTASFSTPPNITAPSNLSAYTQPGFVSLSWWGSSGGTAPYTYFVEDCFGNGCSNFLVAATTTSTSVNFTNLGSGNPVTFRIRAQDAQGYYSPYSALYYVTP